MCQHGKTAYIPVLLCSFLGILFLKEPQLAAQGFESGLRLCTGTILPALFPFFVLTNLLLACTFRGKILRPISHFLGFQSETCVIVLLLSWLGGYAVCAQLVGALRGSKSVDDRDASLVLLMGCCSSPGFVVGCVGGLLLGNLRLGVLLYLLQLTANLLAAALCIGLLPQRSPEKKVLVKEPARQPALSRAISNAVGSSLQVCGCVLFFRMIGAVLVPFFPKSIYTAPLVSACLEISAGCADLAALGGWLALYGCCICMSLLGLSVWVQLSMLLQGCVSLRLLMVHRVLHMALFLILVKVSVHLLPGTMVVYRSMTQRIVPTQRLPLDASLIVFLFLCASLYKVRQNFYNK